MKHGRILRWRFRGDRAEGLRDELFECIDLKSAGGECKTFPLRVIGCCRGE